MIPLWAAWETVSKEDILGCNMRFLSSKTDLIKELSAKHTFINLFTTQISILHSDFQLFYHGIFKGIIGK